MTSERFAHAVARHLASRLRSSTGYRCRCGGCRHQILATARRTGLPVRRLLAALPPEPPREDETKRRSARRPLINQVAAAVTATHGRQRVQGLAAIIAVLN